MNNKTETSFSHSYKAPITRTNDYNLFKKLHY